MSDQTTRPAPAALSEARLAEIRARFDQLGGMVDDDALDLLAELSRLRAGLTQAPELIRLMRRGSNTKAGEPVLCVLEDNICTSCLFAYAADLLSALLPQDDTTKERT